MRRDAGFRASTYRAGPVVARVGRRSPSAEAWLRARRLPCAAMLTAWNPMGRRRPDGWNARAQARLVASLRPWPREEGVSGTARWQEHNLMLGLPPRAARRLARRWRQAAILLLGRGRPARLCWCG